LGQKNKKVQYLINPILNDEIEKKLIDVKNKIKKYQCQFVLTFHNGDLSHETRITALKKS